MLPPVTGARRGLDVRVGEWPGGEPVTPAILRGASGGRPLGQVRPEVADLGRSWGSPVRLRAGTDELPVLSGPAQCASGGWSLPLLAVLPEGTADELLNHGRRLRAERGYEAVGGGTRGAASTGRRSGS